MRLPGRGYKWEQFRDGNEAAVKSGAYSPRKVAQAAEDRRQTWDARLAKRCLWVHDIDGTEVDDWYQREAIKECSSAIWSGAWTTTADGCAGATAGSSNASERRRTEPRPAVTARC